MDNCINYCIFAENEQNMARVTNPFLTYGYEGPKYFCDRINETTQLTRWLTNGNNVALISPRRMGKTGLIQHCFAQESIQKDYNTFLIDIYATKCLADMVFTIGKAIVGTLRPWGQDAINKFLTVVSSLRTGISFDGWGNASWNIDVGDIKAPEYTLEEIFEYIQHADRPCIVAIDEFQQIASYPETNTEALLRTHVQKCRNGIFLFSGSQRDMMSEMFSSPARPFYQSVSMMNISAIPLPAYTTFAISHFNEAGKMISPETIASVYNAYDGTTWYLQKIFNEAYSLTEKGEMCDMNIVSEAIEIILNSSENSYQEMLLQLSMKQRDLLVAICKEKKVSQITSSAFLKKYKLSASSVQKAKEALLSLHMITCNLGVYEPYDKFFAAWINR